jgi:3-deoxy-D-manno-octulosonic-acid transferase
MRRRGNWQPGFKERFGRYDAKFRQAITNRHTLWMHAVSVGEVNLCTQLVRALEPRIPNVKMVVSTTTTTGMGRLQSNFPSHVSKIYYPVDRRAYVIRALGAVKPQAIVLVEAEIWPNFLWRAAEMGVPVFLVNARLTQKSYEGYKRFGFLFRPIFASLRGVGAQNEEDAARLRELGCRPEVIEVVGNLKFDAAKLEERHRLDVPGMFKQLGVAPGSPILVGGSTHDGEEGILADVFLRLRDRFPNLFLVLVPRHFERGRDVGRQLGARNLKFAFRSELNSNSKYRPGELSCLLVNTTGELNHFYEQASVIFVGKSLTAEGGQNPIEPGALGKAMVFGPNMQNFTDVTRAFLEQEGAIQVRDSAQLEQALGELLGSPARCQALGRNALSIVHQNLGAVERTADMIIRQLDSSEVFIAKSGFAALRQGISL